MASFFSKLFGISPKQNYSELIPEPPKFSLAEGSQDQYTGGLQELIDVFNRRSQGQDQFDVMSYIYGPQATELRQNYGIDTNPGDIYSQRSGQLPQLMASMNSRGLLDTGTSGILEGQMRSNLANELARAFGGAKTMQRQDIDNSLAQLQQLFPQRFQAQNIGSQIDYENAMNSYNATLNRNAATTQQRADRGAQVSNLLQGGLGLALGGIGGGMSGMGMFGGQALGGNPFTQFMTGVAGNVTGQYNPYQQMLAKATNPYSASGSTNPTTGTASLLQPRNNYSSNSGLNAFAQNRYDQEPY